MKFVVIYYFGFDDFYIKVVEEENIDNVINKYWDAALILSKEEANRLALKLLSGR